MTRQEILRFVKTEYGTEPEYLWGDYPEYAVLRNRNRKWYGILMNVPKNKFGIDSADEVDVLNVKADEMLVDFLITQTGFYRAYHMNKNKWVSIFLDGSVEEEMIINLIAGSYYETGTKKKK